MMSSKSSRARSISRARRRGRAGVETLEGRPLLSALYTAYPLSSPTTQPGQIVVGPDHNLWFAEFDQAGAGGPTTGSIAMISPATGAIYHHRLALSVSSPTGLTFTPDGNIWFADGANHAIGLFNPGTNQLVEFAMPRPGGAPEQVALGPDGNVWFTDPGSDAVGEVNPTTHAVTEFPLPRADARPFGIVSGPNGDLWFAEYNVNSIASISPTTHAIAEYSSTVTGSRLVNSPLNLTVGTNGDLWFIGDTVVGQGTSEAVYSFNPATQAVAVYGNFGNGKSNGRSVAPGPQGDIWSQFGQTVEATGAFNSDPGPPTASGTPVYGGIVTGPDGNVWSVRTGQVVKAVPVALTDAYIAGTVLRDPVSGGGTLAGQTVYLDLNHDGKLDAGDPSVVTDSTGRYMFGPLAPGTFTVRIVGYPGNAVLSPSGGVQVIAVAGGRVEQVPFDLTTFGSTMPLTFNPAPFGTANPDVQTAEVSGLYQLILGRAPDAVGGAAAVAALKGGEPLSQLASGLLHSTEYFNGLAASDYRAFLGRAAAPAEIKAVTSALQGGLGVEALAQDLIASTEYSALHPTDASFVQAVYNEVLGRSPASSELSAVEGLLGGGLARASVAQSVVGSTEAIDLLVDGFYATFLDRAGDAPGYAHWVNVLSTGGDPLVVAASFASSAEFVQRANATVRV